jgi:hypothetical protein
MNIPSWTDVMNRCTTLSTVVGTILVFMFVSSITHWGLSYAYYRICIGNTLYDIAMSMFNTGGIGCQILFRGMRVSHYEYTKYIMNLFNHI